MDDQDVTLLIFGLSMIGIFILGFAFGKIHSFSLVDVLPSTFGVDIPYQGVNETITMHLDQVGDAKYVCEMN